MYRLQVRFQGSWKWGIREYDTMEDAQKRVKELSKVGIKSRIRKSSELFR